MTANNNATSLTAFKNYLLENHLLGTVEQEFADMLIRRAGDITDDNAKNGLFILAALALQATNAGHSCLDIEEWKNLWLQTWQTKISELKNITPRTPTQEELLKGYQCGHDNLAVWVEELLRHCESLDSQVMATGEKINARPLVWAQDAAGRIRIYLNRFYRYEQGVAQALLSKSAVTGSLPENFEQVIKRHFNDEYQANAVRTALQNKLTIITGGPGRGKTTVLSEILAWEIQRNPQVKIALCAPTGKAADRMKGAIAGFIGRTRTNNFFAPSVTDALASLSAITVHKLLGIYPDSDYPRMNQNNPVDYDVVAVDECSMMSLQLFYQLVNALLPDTKLILLGDPDQLESVDAGNVLAELCRADALLNNIARLVTNYRSRENPGLCAFSDAVANNEIPNLDSLFTDDPTFTTPLFNACTVNRENLEATLGRYLVFALTQSGKRRANWKKPADVDEAFSLINSFKILSPIREGNWGVERLNSLMHKILEIKGDYGDGVPILITRNDPVTGLYNGDIGVCVKGKIHFRTAQGDKEFSPVQLPPHECAFAMTVHKSQGSDYDNVLLVLPDKGAELTRELVYTGITRAKKNLLLIAGREILENALHNPSQRWAGLKQRLNA